MSAKNTGKMNTFSRLLAYTKPYTGRLLLAFLLTFTSMGLELYVPIIFGKIIDMFSEGVPYENVVREGIIYAFVLLFTLVTSVSQIWLFELTGQQVVYKLRNELFEHIHKLHLGFFDVTPVGKLVTRVTNDTETLSELFSNTIVHIIKDIAKILGLAIIMLVCNAKLALRAFVLVPFIVALTFLFQRISRTCHRITRSKITAINTYLSEHISGMKLIQIFNREEDKNRDFESKSRELYRSVFREVMVFAIFRPLIYLLSILALINIIWGGSEMVFLHEQYAELGITVGVLYTFIQYVNSFFEPIQELSEQIGTLQQGIASAEKIFTVLDVEPGIPLPEKPVEMEKIRGKIEFDHVWFAYNDEDWVLRDVSFVIEPGKKVAFVGATGAGKTTILSLVGRYYDVNKGRILVDGVDIRDMSTDELRAAIGQVQQDVFIFTGNIAGNITLGNEYISEEKMKSAARVANAESFIENLERGFEEAVTERGSTLSAGQRQLLSFARTLAYDPAILVMDEATANIDTETELLITEALERMMKGRTTIMVAHRLSTIQHCDCIMVMHKGKIRESGTHQELLERNGIYKKLYEIQLRTAK